MGKNHARIYHDLPAVELAAVVDVDPAVVDSVGKRYHAPAFTDYREMLATVRPQAVSIATPTALHFEVACAAIDAGAHLLIEKPLAASLDEGRQLIKKARAAGLQLMVGHIVRFNPAMQRLKELLRAGELGRIFQIFCRRVGPFPARIRDVGVVVDLAPHDLDIMRYLTGAEPTRVYAETEKRIHTEHEDMILGLVRFPEGISGALEINWLTPTKVREVLVLGERGMFRVDNLTQSLYFYENASASEYLWPELRHIHGVSEGNMTRYAIQRYEPLKAELQAFVAALQNGTPVPVSGADGLAALRLALALVESGRTHQVVEV